LGIGPGDEVITQGFTFVATWESIFDAGAIPVFAEIDESLCLDPEDIEKRVTPRTKAIMPVHMCGGQARMPEIMEVANRLGIPVIEDAAQSCGGRLVGKSVGSFGKMGTFSFDSVKTLTTGEGGMIITDDEALYINAAEYHDHGHDHNPNVGRGLEKRRFIGFNFRMMELQGALGLAQLRKLESVMLPRQREHRQKIEDELRKINQVSLRELPNPDGDIASFVMFHLPDQKKAVSFNQVLSEEGCPTVYWYENTWHYYGHWEHLLNAKSVLRSGYPFKTETGESRCTFRPDALPKTAELLSTCLTIPISIDMEEQIPVIIRAIEKAAKAV
jgi:8-amino-3,8-dideoxy-alpha-D-manno-octulosonate transaminase